MRLHKGSIIGCLVWLRRGRSCDAYDLFDLVYGIFVNRELDATDVQEPARLRTRKALSSRSTCSRVPQPRRLARRRQAALAERTLEVLTRVAGGQHNRPLRVPLQTSKTHTDEVLESGLSPASLRVCGTQLSLRSEERDPSLARGRSDRHDPTMELRPQRSQPGATISACLSRF
jgi:hypothetical protein